MKDKAGNLLNINIGATFAVAPTFCTFLVILSKRLFVLYAPTAS
jgi:hypothetical protein